MSGSGKTSIAKKIAQESDGVAIEGDEIMFHALLDMPKVAYSIFDHYPKDNDSAIDFAYRHYEPLSKEKEKKLFDLTRDYVEQQIIWISENLATDFTTNPKLHKAVFKACQNPKIIVAEIVSSNKFKNLWLEADLRIVVRSDAEKRRKILFDKLLQSSRISNGNVIEIREQVQEEFLRDVKDVDCFLFNDYTQESSDDNARIVNKLIQNIL